MNADEIAERLKGKSNIEKLAMGLVAECICIERFAKANVPRERLADYIATMAAVYVARSMQAGINEVMKEVVKRGEPTEIALLKVEMNLSNEFDRTMPMLNNLREALLQDFPNADRK